VVRLHGVLKKIIPYRDVNFTSKFWKELFAGLGTKLAFSTDRWIYKEGQQDIGGHVEDICDLSAVKVGRVSSTSRVHL